MKTDAKVLHLPIKGVWFNMIAAGIKKEEYRDLVGANGKCGNIPKFCKEVGRKAAASTWEYMQGDHSRFADWVRESMDTSYDVLHLTAGYGHDKPQLWAEIESITIGRGNPDWGAEPGVDYFVIKIGEILHTKNFVLQSEPSQESNV